MVASTLWLLIPIIAIFGTAFLCYGIRFCCEVNQIGEPEGPPEDSFFVDLSNNHNSFRPPAV